MQNKSNRNLYIDIVKGIAIILVVYGHCIEYYSTEYLNGNFFYSDLIHKIIYSFHMPLFMLVSGYLFYGSIRKHLWLCNFQSRFTKLLLPIFLWNSLYLIIRNSFDFIDGKPVILKEEILSYFTALWFLWALFWCSIIVLFVNRWFRDNFFIYIALLIVMLFIPGIYGINLYVYMYPYFIVGYMGNKYQITDKIKSWFKKGFIELFLVILLFLFVVLCRKYTVNDYVYVSGTGILKGLRTPNPYIDFHQLSIDLYRYLVGFVGSGFFLVLISFIYKRYYKKINELIANIGRKSLGIYVISTIFFNSFILPLLSFDSGISYGIVALETVGILLITYILTTFLDKNSWLRILFLGGR